MQEYLSGWLGVGVVGRIIMLRVYYTVVCYVGDLAGCLGGWVGVGVVGHTITLS